MKKLNKKAIVILGTVALALGAFAIPALADEKTQNTYGMMGGNLQSVMNSQAMQEAMNTGDVSKMAEAMNTPEIKQFMGEDSVNQMTEYMKNGNMQNMMGASGQGGMMGGTTGNMMGNFSQL